MKALSILVTLIHLPVWMYLVFKILVAIDASELMWFLYWIWVPLNIAGRVTSELVDKKAVK